LVKEYAGERWKGWRKGVKNLPVYGGEITKML